MIKDNQHYYIRNRFDYIALINLLTRIRTKLEHTWNLETAHISARSIWTEDTKSAGQCFVTAYLLKSYFEELGIFDNVQIHDGTVYEKNSPIIFNHCWIEAHTSTASFLIDLTQDQKTNEKIFISSLSSNHANYHYETKKIYFITKQPSPEAMYRANLLKTIFQEKRSV